MIRVMLVRGGIFGNEDGIVNSVIYIQLFFGGGAAASGTTTCRITSKGQFFFSFLLFLLVTKSLNRRVCLSLRRSSVGPSVPLLLFLGATYSRIYGLVIFISVPPDALAAASGAPPSYL